MITAKSACSRRINRRFRHDLPRPQADGIGPDFPASGLLYISTRDDRLGNFNIMQKDSLHREAEKLFVMTTSVVQSAVPLRSTGTAYLWWLFFGTLGAHKFYLGRPGIGALYACTLGLFGLGVLYDAFTLPFQVRAANARMFSGTEKRDHPPETALDDSEENRFARADELIARYRARQAQSAVSTDVAT